MEGDILEAYYHRVGSFGDDIPAGLEPLVTIVITKGGGVIGNDLKVLIVVLDEIGH